MSSLKHLTAKQLMRPSSPAASFTYDSSAIAGAANVIGRLTDEKAYLGTTLISQRSPFQYDAMGRVTAERQTPYSPSSGTYMFLYGYDLAGNLTCANNGMAALTSGNTCMNMSALSTTIRAICLRFSGAFVDGERHL